MSMTDRLFSHTGQLLPASVCGGSKNGRKCRLRRLRVEFLENGLSEGHEMLHIIGDRQPHKVAGYDVTSGFRSTAKYY